MCTHTLSLSLSLDGKRERDNAYCSLVGCTRTFSQRCLWIIDPNHIKTSLQRGDTMDDFIRAPHNGGQISLYSMYKGYGNVPNESQLGRDE